MKSNLPVTDVEYVLNDTDSLISTTDLNGQITYVNSDFIRITGYTKDELIGAPHNMVRHPDMPAEVFEDMWASFKAGRPWSSIVKNRCKNGNYYWVVANATPVYENNESIGYMSVGTKASTKQIHAASSVYQSIQAGNVAKLKIQDGKIVRSTWFNQLIKVTKLNYFSIKARMVIVTTMMSILLIGIVSLAYLSLNITNDNLRSMYHDRVMPMSQLGSIRELLVQNQFKLMAILVRLDSGILANYSAAIEKNSTDIDSLWKAYLQTNMLPEEKLLITKFSEDYQNYIDQVIQPGLTILRTNNGDLARHIFNIQASFYEPLDGDIDKLLQLQVEVVKQEHETLELSFEKYNIILMSLIIGAIFFVLFPCLLMIRGMVQQFNQTIFLFKQIGQGNYNNHIKTDRRDEIGKVLESLKGMQIKLGFDRELVAEQTEELLRNQLVWKLAIEGSGAAVWDLNIKTQAVNYSPRWLEILGYSQDEIVASDTNWGAMIHPDDFLGVKNIMKEYLAGVIPLYLCEFRLRCKDNSYRWMLSRGMLIDDGQYENPIRMIGTTTDINDLKLSEEAGHIASRAKSAFLANMSHEIRTPMNGVVGMVDVLIQTPLNNNQIMMVNVIRESAHNQLSIINDILDFSKIESGKLDLSIEAFLIEDVLQSVCVLLDPIAVEKKVDLSLYLDPEIPLLLESDCLRLKQILTNLVGNAIKFSSALKHRGEVSMRVEPIRIEGRYIWVNFSITDNGIGMSEATLAKLFAPFAQADSSTCRRYGGSGLGLVISRQLAELLDGEITVQSMVDKGSTFTLAMPFKIVKKQPEIEISQTEGLSCLLIGPDEQITADVAKQLMFAGAKVQRVASIDDLDPLMLQGDGLLVWVKDEIKDALSPDEIINAAKIAVEKHHNLLVVTNHLSLGRGRRRKPRRLSPELVQIDGNLLTRYNLLTAVAMAAGLVELEQRVSVSSQITPAVNQPVSREQALQQGRLILVAEDNLTNQVVINEQLNLLGYVADIMDDGYDAFKAWQSGDYALLITDIHMPRMDGYELTTAIRKQEKNSSKAPTPIIALTAIALKGEAENCLDLGMNDYLSKPATLTELKVTIDRWLPQLKDDLASSFIIDKQIVTTTEDSANDLLVWDSSALIRMVGTNRVLHQRLLTKFLNNGREQLTSINAAAQVDDVIETGLLAHTLKSAARTVGAMQLGELCQTIELTVAKGDGYISFSHVEQLAQVWLAAETAIKQQLSEETILNTNT